MRSMAPAALAASICALGVATAPPVTAGAAAPHVLLVGSYNGATGPYGTIQAAVDAASPGDWILVGPGDYHERADHATSTWPAGVWIDKPGIHLRGMNRNSVIVDGTNPGAVPCSSRLADQDLGPGGQGRNGIEVYGKGFGANQVSIDNLTVCNFLTDPSGARGNQIWWNGGDGSGQIGMSGYRGSYLTATSTYSNGVNYPAGSYGIFSSNATHGSWTNSYASNMADSSFYIGACQQRCDAVMNHDHGQYSSLCISTTNAGGYLLIENTECDRNKTGPVSNSQNNDDAPSPQIGLCDLADRSEPQRGALGTRSCTVWMNNYLHDNNNPNVPGNGTSGLAGGGPVGAGLILAGTRYITLYHNTIVNNDSWGELIADLPDQEAGPSNCQGGTFVPPPVGVCYFQAFGNVSIGNTFKNNGSYGNPSNGDIGLATIAHDPGNCFSADTDPRGLTSDPAGMENGLPHNPYRPVRRMCTTANAGDMGPLAAEVLCASQLLAPCPTLNTLCDVNASLPCISQAPCAVNCYPRPTPFTLTMPPAQATMPNPCSGVPANAFCPAPAGATAGPRLAALPALGAAAIIGAGALTVPWRRRRRTG
ncbi:MAG: hypothetical protein ACRENL_07370 [Candidatus Dormibacteria bacterium]